MTIKGVNGWILSGVLAGALVMTLVSGIRHAFGIFLPPISADMGWGREVFSLGFAVQMFLLGAMGPFFGLVADRFGPGRVLLAGGVLHALGLYGITLSATPAGFVLSAGVVTGLGAAGISNVIMIGAVGRMVSEAWQGRAVGILMAGGSLGQIMMLPVAHQMITRLGWHGSLVVLASLMVAGLPLILLVVWGGRNAKVMPPKQTYMAAVHEARGHRGYLLLSAGFFVCGFHVFFLAVHLPAYAQDLGLNARVGANALMIIGLFNMIGSNTWGYLGDQYRKKHMLGLIYLLRSLAIIAFLLVPPSEVAVYLFSAVMGFLWLGTVPLTSGLVGVFFGREYLSMLYGFVFLSHQVGGFLGSWMAGRLFDLTGNYNFTWGVAIALGFFAALIHLPIDDRTREQRNAKAQTA